MDDVLTFLTALRLAAIDTELLITMTVGPVCTAPHCPACPVCPACPALKEGWWSGVECSGAAVYRTDHTYDYNDMILMMLTRIMMPGFGH